MAKIKAIFLTTTSSRDSSGNCYHYLSWTDTETGARVAGVCDSESSFSSIMGQMGLCFEEIFYTQRVVPIRQFNFLTKGLRHLFTNDFIVQMNDARRALQTSKVPADSISQK